MTLPTRAKAASRALSKAAKTPTGGSLGSAQLDWLETLLLGLNVVSYDAGVATTAALDNYRVCAPDAVP